MVLKRYAVDHAGKVPVPACAPSTGKSVAVIGGGPGGLSAAYFLSLMGHHVVIYEKRSKLRGYASLWYSKLSSSKRAIR